MEIEILNWIQGLRTDWGDVFFSSISAIANAGIIWIVLTAVLLIIPKTRKCGICLAAALIVDVILCNGILKPLIARVRPYDVNVGIEIIIAKPKDYSFPSGHTAVSFASVTALFLCKKKNLWIPSLVLAVLIAFSRLYLYVHYPTDVIGGIVTGIASGVIGWLIIQKISNMRGEKKCS